MKYPLATPARGTGCIQIPYIGAMERCLRIEIRFAAGGQIIDNYNFVTLADEQIHQM